MPRWLIIFLLLSFNGFSTTLLFAKSKRKGHHHYRQRHYRRKRARRFPYRYRLRWGRKCPRFGLKRSRCYRVARSRDIRKIHKMALLLLKKFQKVLRKTPKKRLAQLARSHQKYFSVERWWWDRCKRDWQYNLIDTLDRLVLPALKRYPRVLYLDLLRRTAQFLGDPALSLPRETALLSRLSRWLHLKKDVSFSRHLARRLGKKILELKECRWWYINFIATFAPEELKRLSSKIDPTWCSAKKVAGRLPFMSYSQIVAQLRRWGRRYRRIAKVRKIGLSAEGRAIWALRLGYRGRRRRSWRRPSIIFVGNQHSDEHLGADLLVDLARRLIRRYRRKERRTLRWFRTRQIWIIPVLNPDGKRFDLLGGLVKFWRFNRQIQADGQVGTDLNRNYNFKWRSWRYCRRGRITLPGPYPFSAPETRALRRLVRRLRNVKAILDVHQYGGLVLIPFAYTRRKLPSPYQRYFENIGRFLTHFNHYRVKPARYLYPHNGTLGDWGFGRRKALSLVLELGHHRQYVDKKQMLHIFRQNVKLLDRFIEIGIAPFRKAKNLTR